MSPLITIITFVTEAVWSIWPYFVITIFLAVLINALELSGMIRQAFDRHIGTAVLLATLVGAFSPFCSCTVVPVIAGLLAGGVPLAPIMSFWIASPTMDPEIFAMSVGILGWPLALVRLAATLLLSLGAGYVTLALAQVGILPQFRPVARPAVDACCASTPAASNAIPLAVVGGTSVMTTAVSAASCGSGACALPASVQPGDMQRNGWAAQLRQSIRAINWHDFGREMVVESWRIGRWLLLAFVLEALILLYVPQEAIIGVLGQSNSWAIPLAATIGVPLYLTNISALPIVDGLLAQGMQPGAAIAFLLAGPVTTIPAMTAVWGIVQRRIFVLYVGIGLLGAVLMGALSNFIL